MQRAQDKIASMQARAGAIDELLASGALTNLDAPVDDIQAQLDKVSGSAQVENDLAALKAELATAGPAGALPAPEAEAAEPEPTEAEVVDAEPEGASATGDAGTA